MTDSKELVELAKRGGLEMTQGSSVGTSPASRLRGDSVASVGLEFEHLMDLDAGLSGVPVVFDGPSPRRRTGSAGSASDGLGPAFAMDFEDPEGAESASRGAAAPSRHRRASSPGEQVVGGLFFDFEAVRTESRDRDARRMTWSRRWRPRDASSRRWRRHDHTSVDASRESAETSESPRNGLKIDKETTHRHHSWTRRRTTHPNHKRTAPRAAQARSSAATTTTPTASRRRRCGGARGPRGGRRLHYRSRPMRGRWLVLHRWLVPFLRLYRCRMFHRWIASCGGRLRRMMPS